MMIPLTHFINSNCHSMFVVHSILHYNELNSLNYANERWQRMDVSFSHRSQTCFSLDLIYDQLTRKQECVLFTLIQQIKDFSTHTFKETFTPGKKDNVNHLCCFVHTGVFFLFILQKGRVYRTHHPLSDRILVTASDTHVNLKYEQMQNENFIKNEDTDIEPLRQKNVLKYFQGNHL